MEKIEISFIDTGELNHYIHESVRCWENTCSYSTLHILSKRIWRDDLHTKAVFVGLFNRESRYAGPNVIIYIIYDEVAMAGNIELEYAGRFSKSSKYNMKNILVEVFSSFDPSTAPLLTGVKCQHCGARYVYKKRIGVVNCQNCGKQFDLGYEKVSDEF